MMLRRWRGFHPPAFYSLLTSFKMMIASVSSVNSFIKLVSSFIMSTFITSFLHLYHTLYRV
nr:MAG TPA: hypothetical protein [Caudoviricetes sp.]